MVDGARSPPVGAADTHVTRQPPRGPIQRGLYEPTYVRTSVTEA
jgi:hypothetical protein